MPGGDLYEIADQGMTLSGGQRARIALARALYQVLYIDIREWFETMQIFV
jgi:ABC-type protease/lipase transport system fused ATPase/permease subunit